MKTKLAKYCYVSVDLDFWLTSHPDSAFLDRLIHAAGVENVVAAVDHSSIVPNLGRYRNCSEMVNLDAHSDLGSMIRYLSQQSGPGEQPIDINDLMPPFSTGSWASYVNWTTKHIFTWAAPSHMMLHDGRTDDDRDVPFSKLDQCEPKWERLRSYVAKPPNYGIDFTAAAGACIVLSPDWCNPNALPVFRELVQTYSLPLLDILWSDLEQLTVEGTILNDDEQQALLLAWRGVPVAKWPEHLRGKVDELLHLNWPSTYPLICNRNADHQRNGETAMRDPAKLEIKELDPHNRLTIWGLRELVRITNTPCQPPTPKALCDRREHPSKCG